MSLLHWPKVDGQAAMAFFILPPPDVASNNRISDPKVRGWPNGIGVQMIYPSAFPRQLFFALIASMLKFGLSLSTAPEGPTAITGAMEAENANKANARIRTVAFFNLF